MEGNTTGMSVDNRFYEMQDRDTPRMFAPSLREAVREEPEVLALEAAVAALDLSALEAQYARVGHPAYPPAVMLKVLVYGYSLGLRASRQLERACKRDDAFRFLAGGLRPDHNSLCRFRLRHAAQLPELFAQTVHLCQEAGLVSLGDVALDGTKLRANRAKATLRAAQQLAQALQEAEAADGAEGEAEAQEEESAFPVEGLKGLFDRRESSGAENNSFRFDRRKIFRIKNFVGAACLGFLPPACFHIRCDHLGPDPFGDPDIKEA